MWLMTRRIGTSSSRCAATFSKSAVRIENAAEISSSRSPYSIIWLRRRWVSVVISISWPAWFTGAPITRMTRFVGSINCAMASRIEVQKGCARKS